LINLSPVHTSDNVAKNGDIVAEIGENVANSPVHTSDNVSETGDIVAGVDGALNERRCWHTTNPQQNKKNK